MTSGNERVSIREEQRGLTRRRILDAAARAFQSSGYGSVTFDEIAELAGISRGTIYLHFKNKSELLRGVLDASDPELDRLYARLREARTIAELDEFFEEVISFWEQVAPVHTFAYQAGIQDESTRQWLRAIERRHTESIAEALIAHGVPERLAHPRAVALMAMYLNLAEQAGARRLPVSRQELAGALRLFFAAAKDGVES